jgi:CRISPR-associated protein Cas1
VLSVYKQNAKLAESRLFETSQVAVFGNIQLSTQAMQQLMQHSIPLLFFTSGGWFYGIAQGLPHKNIELRMAQYKAAEDEQICLKLARGWVATKIENCRTMLLRNHTDLPNGATMELKNMVDAAKKTESIASLLGIEGTAARIYFSLFSGMLKIKADNTENSAWIFDFSGRNRRPPRDPVNAMLSWLYAVLAKEFTVTALSVGLEPYLGFYHQPRYGRPALALDLMEELPPFKVR